MERQFNLKKPCKNCPFTKADTTIHLQEGRREEIIESLLTGESMSFPCHKSVYKSDGRNFDEEGEYKPTDIQQCPGAMAVCKKFGRDAVIVQVSTRMGFIPEGHYDEALDETIEPEQLNIDKKKAHIYD